MFLTIYIQSSSDLIFSSKNINYHYSSNYLFNWPLEYNFSISSYFGKRIHPISKKTSYHSGIDIPAKENTNIYSISNGIVSYVGFLGSYGYAIKISFNNFEIIYGHISPTFLINKNNKIFKGQLIATIGPKYVTQKNQYPVENGYYLNGLTTGPHLHLTIKKDGLTVNPLDYL